MPRNNRGDNRGENFSPSLVCSGTVLCLMVVMYYFSYSAPVPVDGGDSHRPAFPSDGGFLYDETGAMIMREIPSYRSTRDSDMIPQAQMKMDMEGYFETMRRGGISPPRAGVMGTPQPVDRLGSDSFEDCHTPHPSEYNGAVVSELPVLDQGLCGSCWAVASALSLKANLNLKEVGLGKHEVPALQFLVSCSNLPNQLMNFRNSDPKIMMKNGPTRHMSCGCEGGLTAMSLAMLQVESKMYIDDISDYRAGRTGTIGEGPVVDENTINLPGMMCNDYKATSPRQLNLPDMGKLDIEYLYRRGNGRGKLLPSTRDVRDFIYKHRVAVVYVDTDAGLGDPSLYSAKSVKLPTCRWTEKDVIQSSNDDMGSISQFKYADHALLLVGWSCERKAWILHNSWGMQWGDQGQIYVRDDNVCAEDHVTSSHSEGGGPLCMFLSSVSAFVSK